MRVLMTMHEFPPKIFHQEKLPALHIAAIRGNQEAVVHLVGKGTDINIEDDYAVIILM